MHLQRIARLAIIGLMFAFTGDNMADDKDTKDKEVEVAFPALPEGAGKLDDDAPKVFTTTKSGLKYRVLRKGNAEHPTARQSVEVNYHGWLDDESVFDSSYNAKKSISFPLNRVIKGWTEGMQLVGEGGMIELEIPSDLGYGARGAPGAIPPNARIHFLVELIDIK